MMNGESTCIFYCFNESFIISCLCRLDREMNSDNDGEDEDEDDDDEEENIKDKKSGLFLKIDR